jgi:hypothetical protein
MQSLYENTNLSWAGYYLNAPFYNVDHTATPWSGNYQNLTQQGWTLIPIFVGQQNYSKSHGVSIPPVTEKNAAMLALQDSEQAISQDVPKGSTIYLDVEPDAKLTGGELTYIYDWCADLSASGYFPGIYTTTVKGYANTIANDVPGVAFWIAHTATASGPIVPTVPNGGVVLPTPDLSLSGYSGEIQGWQYLINTYSFSPNVSLSGVDLDSFSTIPSDHDTVAEKPLVIVAATQVTVEAGGSVPLGVILGAVDADDSLSVTISGVPSFESISAAGSIPVVTQNGTTSSYTFNGLPTSDWNNGLVVTSTYTGNGHPTNTLTVTVSNTTLGESATALAKTISVKDPPADTAMSGAT